MPPTMPRQVAADLLQAWLATAFIAGLVGVLLFIAAHGSVISFFGAAGSLSLISAAAAASYGFRRAASVRNWLATDQAVRPIGQITLLTATALAATTALLAVIGLATAR